MSKSEFIMDKENLEVRLTRVFDAPRERLWKAYTDPAEIPKWWGPAIYTTVVDKMDVRVGGLWRFVQTEAGGKEHGFSGVYKEVVELERLSDTFEYEPIPGHVLLETVTFEDISSGQTKVVATSKYENLEDLEGMVAMGMESGAVEGQERLAELVENA